MSGSNITTAANEYATRPADERYGSIDDLIAAARADQQLSAERNYNVKDLHAVAVYDPTPECASVQLVSPKGQATFTHWSFGQLCRMIGAPAGYLRTLPASLTADCLNDGILRSDVGQAATLLVRAANGRPEPTIRSVTSDTYGRLWDGPLYTALQATLGADFQLPPTWEGGADGPRSGAYRGDRDSFMVTVNGGSIVNDPSARGGNGQMFRGLMIRNSEVGACSVTIEQILFEYICGNHNFWGAVVDKRFKRRHVGGHVLRDVVREIGAIGYAWTQRSAAQDERLIRLLIDHELASTKEAIVDELQKMGATKAQATSAYDTSEQSEIFTASPRSFWGLNQGLTRLSQSSAYQDERFELDSLAGKILARGAKLVAA
jgi:hypothetical protein